MRSLLLSFLICSSVVPAAPGAVTVQVAGQLTPILYFFGGENVTIPMEIHTLAGSKVDIRADLFQIGGPLAAPLLKNIPVAEAQEEKCEAQVALPAVRSKVAAILKLEAREKSELQWRSAGTVRLVILPTKETVWKSLNSEIAALRKRGIKLVFVGEAAFFSTLLEELGSPFEREAKEPGSGSTDLLFTLGGPELIPARRFGKGTISFASNPLHPERLTIVRTKSYFHANLNCLDPQALNTAARSELLSEILAEFDRFLNG